MGFQQQENCSIMMISTSSRIENTYNWFKSVTNLSIVCFTQTREMFHHQKLSVLWQGLTRRGDAKRQSFRSQRATGNEYSLSNLTLGKISSCMTYTCPDARLQLFLR